MVFIEVYHSVIMLFIPTFLVGSIPGAEINRSKYAIAGNFCLTGNDYRFHLSIYIYTLTLPKLRLFFYLTTIC